MIGKVIFWLFFFVAMTVVGYQIYLNLPREPVSLTYDNKLVDNNSNIVDYGTTPVFGENMRFNHNNISYYISPSCSNEKEKRMKKAFSIFENNFPEITFISSVQEELSDITVLCSDEEIRLGENLFTAGEGGPSSIINTSQFKIIEKGVISLYKETSTCDYPVVELHELLHVFGFDHTLNPKSIMYNISYCDQRITPDMKVIITKLYQIPQLPDLVIKNLEASKRGRYLDFNVTVLNEGLVDSQSFDLAIIYRGEVIEKFMIEEMEVGSGRTIRATNVRLPSLNVEALNFVADYSNEIIEFNENNNLVQMKTVR